MSTISVVNGSNIFGRFLIASLARRHSLKLLDLRPYRRSVYQMQRELKQHNATIEKYQISTPDSMSKAIEGSDTIIYINHDYFSLSSDKNDVLKVAAQRAKRQGVQKFISLSPVEFDHFFEDGNDSDAIHTPIERRRLEAQEYARSQFPEMTNLRVNLLYGEQSYSLRYLTQCLLRGILPENYNIEHYLTTFYPIHLVDVLQAVEHALENQESVKGKNYALIGSQGKNLGQLIEALEGYVGQKPKKVPVIHLTNLFWRWLVGQTHDKNIVRCEQKQLEMLMYYQKHDGAFTKESGASYFEEHGLEYKAPSFSESYAPSENLPDFMHPLMTDYKRIELD